ncbi:MAG: glycosyltransferase [Saprospiraceae bacterium]|nr:glycosyltransferase [Saprospiraceae bacterium]HMW38945.1 glycosyltransferase [Saprospiraceae bacterium]HMX88125.1 glycosyltransferase [Saprospiraceae bacterium]HMZ38908.1 glycosyltransferase [Saprospiraceae bacterium]HNA64934.1 glycosyltransferase [Saprospiraceae bacterium]
MFQVMLFVSLGLLIHSYLIYPGIVALLYFFKLKKSVEQPGSNSLPNLCCIIPAYNEEKVIASKIQSVLDCDYPGEKLQILVGSDQSSDSTAEIVDQFVQRDSRIQFFNFQTRRGKPQVLNDLVQIALRTRPQDSDLVIVFTDANVMLEYHTLQRLAATFNNPRIGLCDSRMISVDTLEDNISGSEEHYLQLESQLKYWEGFLWGCMMGPFGGCYAVRANLVPILPENILVDDFYVSMKVIEQGYQTRSAPDAMAFEKLPGQLTEEFRRKERISAGNMQNLFYFVHLLTHSFPVSFAFISHKIIRWTGPVWLILAMISSLMLSLNNFLAYSWIFLFMLVVFFIVPWVDRELGKAGIHLKPFRRISYFAWMNLALLMGLFKYLGGVRSSIWQPTQRV